MLTNLEAWIRRRLGSYLWRQWGNGHNRFKELRRRGVPKFSAAPAAGFTDGFLTHVRTPGGPTGLAQPILRVTRSPPSLCLCTSMTGRTAVVRDPYARWCGRGRHREVSPYPDQSQFSDFPNKWGDWGLGRTR
ncbi:hypothetical protein O7A70_30060 [Mesorhizobium sp. Cs1299R1N1]|uniref:hypothetical protein n=1 Tax=Mesorhizobium sp. Cs1299R1N1 TaxID=3015172 RepID=UPI00301D8576